MYTDRPIIVFVSYHKNTDINWMMLWISICSNSIETLITMSSFSQFYDVITDRDTLH